MSGLGARTQTIQRNGQIEANYEILALPKIPLMASSVSACGNKHGKADA
jgi:hypothetical protein